MLNEGYVGICPNCGYDRMLVRYGSFGYFERDACPNCGFYYGHNSCDPEEVREEGWNDEIEYLKEELEKRALPLSLLGIMLYIETLPDYKEIDQVFQYPDDFNYDGK
jgi:hypothetical protein